MTRQGRPRDGRRCDGHRRRLSFSLPFCRCAPISVCWAPTWQAGRRRALLLGTLLLLAHVGLSFSDANVKRICLCPTKLARPTCSLAGWLARLARHDRETGADLLPKGEEGRRRRRTTGCRAMRPPARLTPLDRNVRCAVAWRHDAPCQHSFIRGLLALVMSHLKNNSSAATFHRGCGRSAVATQHPSRPLWAACLLDTVPPRT